MVEALPVHSQRALLWWLVCGSLVGACLIAWQLPVEWQLALRWRAGSWTAQPWTLWSASLMHLSQMHVWLNVLTFACLAILGGVTGVGQREALAVLLAWPLSTLALSMWPEVGGYAGLSGLNHTVAVVIIAHSAHQSIAEHRIPMIAAALAALLVGKLLWEQAWIQPMRLDALWGFPVVQAAHLGGAISGLFAWVSLRALQSARIFRTNAVVE